MATVYAVNCRIPTVSILRNCLDGLAEVKSIEDGDLTQVEPLPEAVFLEWKEELRTMVFLLEALRKSLSFRDVPIIVLTDRDHELECKMGTRRSVSDILLPPLQPEAVRQALKKALTPVGAQPKIDVRLVNPFVEATVNVLRTMAHIPSERREVLLKRNYLMFGDISGVIGIMGQTLEGSVAITFHEDLARRVVSAMLGQSPDELSGTDLNDGVGEIVNMISGNAKTLLSGEGLSFDLALPTIVSGRGHEVAHRPGTPCLVIVFETDKGEPFALQVAVGTHQT